MTITGSRLTLAVKPTGMLIQPVRHSPHRDFGGLPVWEMKDSRRNAAEGDAPDVIFQAQVQRVPVAVRQILFKVFCESPGYDRSDDVNYLLRGKIVTVRQHRHGCRLFIV